MAGGKPIDVRVQGPDLKALEQTAREMRKFFQGFAGVRDVTCGFRAYRAGALRRAAAHSGHLVDAAGFACMLDLLLSLRDAGAALAEVPIDLRYDRKRSASKLRVWRTAAETLRVVGRHGRPRER